MSISFTPSIGGYDLRENLWDWLRDPATGAPVSRTPVKWAAHGFPEHVPFAPAPAGE